MLISPQPDQEGNKLQRQKILSFIHPFILIIGGILVPFIYITRLASNEIFSPPNKIHREEGRAKDLSAALYNISYIMCRYFVPYGRTKLHVKSLTVKKILQGCHVAVLHATKTLQLTKGILHFLQSPLPYITLSWCMFKLRWRRSIRAFALFLLVIICN